MSIGIDKATRTAIPLDVQQNVQLNRCPRTLVGAFSAFMRATDDHVRVIDMDGLILFANRSSSGRRVGAVSAPDELRWQDLWPLERQPEALTVLNTAFDRGTARITFHARADSEREIVMDVALTRVETESAPGPVVIAVARALAASESGDDGDFRLGVTDGLTGLPNAVRFHRELSSKSGDGYACTRPFALVMIDLDGFKQLNSRLGPQVCDALLARFAELLKGGAGDCCFLARSGGDEFALIIEGTSRHNGVLTRVQRLIRSCTEQLSDASRLVGFSASAGIAHFPADGTSDQELLRNAHAALKAAKGVGRGRCVSFDGNLRQQLQKHSSMLDLARAGIAGDWIRPYYQPKVDLASGAVVGLEALLRWQSDNGLVHLPASISAAFGDPEIATRISRIMLQKIIADTKRWRETGSTVPVAINVSTADFQNTHFAEEFLEQVSHANLPTSAFEIEVTEGVLLGVGADDVDAALRRFNAAGVRIALDDFGTGFASLTHLKQYPVDVIKIDRSFISNLVTSPDDRAIVSAMINLGTHLAIEVVAEGVETENQATLLRDLGCHVGQGFYFAPALPSEEVPGTDCPYHFDTNAPVTRFASPSTGIVT